jgi:hypothetical protein
MASPFLVPSVPTPSPEVYVLSRERVIRWTFRSRRLKTVSRWDGPGELVAARRQKGADRRGQ